MCAQMRHRGPDDEGYYSDEFCAMGMRRLSIIDLKTGRQPISNEDASVQVVFNGEIYNYRELRNDLAQRGHRFVSASDTEVLVHLYEECGEQAAVFLRGMFACAFWDRRQRRLVLLRDRFGKKPLYFAEVSGEFYFASEIKCLRAVGVPLELDDAALRHYLHLGFIPHPRTIYRSIRKVSPGGWLVREPDGEIRQGRYWRLPPPAVEPPPATTREELVASLRRQFDEAVRIRMLADVPLGAFLSGGIDSASVVASMALQSSEPVKTFSVGFAHAKVDELPFAQLVASRYRTEHYSIRVTPDIASLIPRLVRQFDEPFADSSAIPTYLISEFASQHVKVALSGDGGDELFAGYPSFRQVRRLQAWDWAPRPLRAVLGALAKGLPYRARGKNFLRLISRPGSLERYFEGNYSPRFLLESLVRQRWLPPDGEAYLREVFQDFLPDPPAGPLEEAIYFESTCKLTEDILVKVDRMSMANSLEIRCPFLDHQLAETAARIPPIWNLANGRGKSVFLEAVGDRLPPALWQLPKTGFSAPLAAWFRGPLRELLGDHLGSANLSAGAFVKPRFVRALLEEHWSGRRDNQALLWRLLVLELWLRDNETVLAFRAAG